MKKREVKKARSASGATREPVRVSIAHSETADRFELLSKALQRARFWSSVQRVCRGLRRRRDRLRIVIKPDLDGFDSGAVAATDPELVEYLVELLYAKGYSAVAVGDGRNESDSWLFNRESLVVPDLIGYRFATRHGDSYEVVDLQGNTVEVALGTGRKLPLSRDWLEADYRIVFAKNKTHAEDHFALCAHNLIGLTPQTSRARSSGSSAAEVCLEILRHCPPEFNIIDGYVSCHGSAGGRAPRPLPTHTFIASGSTLLADWAGALKMGADPFAPPISSKGLRKAGLPDHHVVDGSLLPYPRWKNVHPLLAESGRRRRGSDALGRLSAPWLQVVDRETFPFRDFLDERLNSYLSPLWCSVDDDRGSFLILLTLNHLISYLSSTVSGLSVLLMKGQLERQERPLEIDLKSLRPGDFNGIPRDLEPYRQVVEQTPPNRDGLRWRLIDGSVVFAAGATLPIDYDEFVERVDICCSIQYMNDYIGGSTEAVRRDRKRRVTCQAERNLYLQQPNWMVLFGGKVIDVEKLDFIEYGADTQRISWKTVSSSNESADVDDGSVTFARTKTGKTEVRIFAIQRFRLPPVFQLLDVERLPETRDRIIERAYTTFFDRTLENMRAVYEGREFRIGRAPDETAGRLTGAAELGRYIATAAAALAEILRDRPDPTVLARWFSGRQTASWPTAPETEPDGDGFRHFTRAEAGPQSTEKPTGPDWTRPDSDWIVREVPDFIEGLADAIRKDLESLDSAAGQEP